MGIFDFIKNEFIEVIDWPDAPSDAVLYKFPDKGNKIMNGAQLTVRESQVAVLMNEGEFGDEYKPGRHELSTKNMPITTTLKSWKYLFDSPFKVDVFFVSTKQFSNLKWGTSNPVIVRDPEFQQARIKAFGTYTIRVTDARKFIKEFSGASTWGSIDDVSAQLRNTISSKLAEGLAEAKISLLDLAANFTELGDKLVPVFQKDFETWGIELGQFYIESISLPEEVEKMLDKTTSLKMLEGKLQQFNQMQGGIAIEKMAENDSAGGAGGAATGVLLTNMMQQNMQPPSGNSQIDDKQKALDLLKQLGELRAAGVITEEEFTKKKTDLLNKI